MWCTCVSVQVCKLELMHAEARAGCQVSASTTVCSVAWKHESHRSSLLSYAGAQRALQTPLPPAHRCTQPNGPLVTWCCGTELNSSSTLTHWATSPCLKRRLGSLTCWRQLSVSYLTAVKSAHRRLSLVSLRSHSCLCSDFILFTTRYAAGVFSPSLLPRTYSKHHLKITFSSNYSSDLL